MNMEEDSRMNSDKSSRLGKNIIYQLIYQGVTVLSPLIVTPYISRTLGAEGIGKYSYAYSIAYYFVLIAGLGISTHGTRQIACSKNNKDTLENTFSNLFWLHITTSVITTIVYLVMIVCGLNNENADLSLIMTFYLLSAVVDVKWCFQGLELFKLTVLRSVIIKIIYIISIFLFVNGRDDTAIYTFIMAFVSFFLSELSLFVLIPKHVKLRKPYIGGIIGEIRPLFLLFIPSVGNLLLRHFDKIMLGTLSTYEQLGFYENSDKVFTILSTVITAVGDVILPRISNLLASNDNRQANRIFTYSLRIGIITSCAFTFGIISIAKEFVPIFFGNEFYECIEIIQWIAPSIIMVAFSASIRKQYLIPRYKNKVYIIATFSGLVCNIILNSIFIPPMGAMGAVYATLVAELLIIIIHFMMIHKELDYLPFFKDLIVFALIGFVMFAFVRVSSLIPVFGIWGLFIEIVVGFICFSALSCIYLKLKKDDLLIHAIDIIKRR